MKDISNIEEDVIQGTQLYNLYSHTYTHTHTHTHTQWPTGADKSLDHAQENKRSASALVGVGAILLACISSGFSGVYIEKILKQSNTSMWIRNIQLCESYSA